MINALKINSRFHHLKCLQIIYSRKARHKLNFSFLYIYPPCSKMRLNKIIPTKCQWNKWSYLELSVFARSLVLRFVAPLAYWKLKSWVSHLCLLYSAPTLCSKCSDLPAQKAKTGTFAIFPAFYLTCSNFCHLQIRKKKRLIIFSIFEIFFSFF